MLSIATDASTTVSGNSFLGFDDTLGHLAIGLDTVSRDRSASAFGAGLDATGNHWDTADAATIQRLIHDRSDDSSRYDHYIRPDPTLSAPHADAPDPTPWR